MPDPVPRQTASEPTHVDGLDGLRGLAIAAVLLFDGGISWARGGFLGAELFFVLSGFLITSLLVRRWLETGSLELGDFWARRARRLFPALFVLVIAVGIYSAIRGRFGAVPGLFGDGISALLGYANWHEIAAGSGSVITGAPISPFRHLWSLAIEEQFYVIWPLVLLLIATTLRRDAARWLSVLTGLSLAMLAGSAIDAAVLFHHGPGFDRVLYGTDTRASGLLAGVVLALVMARLKLRGGDARARRRSYRLTPAVSLLSAGALIGTCALMATVQLTSRWLYPLGLLLTDALCVTMIVAIITTPAAIAGRVLSLAPLRWIGTISYGLYLWHVPLFLWISPSGSLTGWKLFVVRALVTAVVATASYLLIEQPVRLRRWPAWLLTSVAPVSVGAGAVALALAASAGAQPAARPSPSPLNLKGTGSCKVHLANTPTTGEVSPPLDQLPTFELDTILRGTATWPTGAPADEKTVTFHTCDPTPRALVVGDSIAFTIGLPDLSNEQNYGMAISDAAILGCAFESAGKLDDRGKLVNVPPGCPDAPETWAKEATAFGAGVVIIELGYRDEFDWELDGKLQHLGEAGFDSYVEGQIRSFIKVLGDDAKRKLLFLSIPYVAPQYMNGQRDPQTTDIRHQQINDLIAKAVDAAGSDNAEVLNIDTIVSPDNTYTGTVNGRLCRTDGIHFSPYCAGLLERPIFTAARALLKK